MQHRSNPLRVALAGLTGTTIEYYDFFVYGTASALVFGKLFFPGYDAFTATLLSFSTFAVAFIARPVGGVVLGHFGDRIGRKAMLILTLTTMGLSTLLIGLLPGYESIGVAAPILLVVFRFIQGFSLGGEYGGAVLMTVEHAQENRRGFYGSWVQLGAPVGLVLANLAFLAISGLSGDAMLTWGWRIPFVASAVLVGVGLIVRLTITESPSFQQVKEQGAVRKLPILTVLKHHPKQVLLTAGASISVGVTFYSTTVFGLSYAVNTLGKSSQAMLVVIVASMVLTAAGVLFFGHLSDKVGRKPVFIGGLVGLVVCAFPWIWLTGTHSVVLTLAGYLLIFIPYSATWGTLGTFLAEAFSTDVRYTGLSLGNTVGYIAGPAFAPIIATNLLKSTGSYASVGWYLVIAAVLSGVAAVWTLAFKDHPVAELARTTAAQRNGD
ncbi:MAG TPA: MFS transporter [Amycolatopsis sp.]|nr:MFS transporter [Amycolatopsis sp.]